MAIAPGLMQQKPRGLFGSSARVDPQPAMAGPEQQQKPGFDWRKLIGVLGDSLSIAGGGQPMFVPNMIDQRNRQQAQQYAEQQYQRRRQDENADWQARQEIEAQNRAPTYFDDNAGNRWSVNPSTGERKLIFRDPNAKRIPQKVTGPNGEEYIEYVEIPNNVNEDGTFKSAAPVATLPEGYTVRGGTDTPSVGQAPPRVPTASVPSILGYDTQSRVVTPQDYQTLVLSMGKANADAYIRRQGLTLGGR